MNNAQRPIYEMALAGISYPDAMQLRRISRSLRRWYERECGTDTGCIERDEETGQPFWHFQDCGLRYVIPDLEKSALKRLDAIMARYPGLTAYVQGDPRGCALYILRPGDIREGQDIDCCYTNGIAVY